MKAKSRKRPVLVWVVFLYVLFTVVVGAGGLLAVWHAASHSERARAAIEAMTTTNWILIALNMTLELGGAIALFKLRRVAFPLFVGLLFISVILMVIHFRESTLSVAANHGANMVAFSLAFRVLVCAYAWRLRSRSVLV